MDKAAEFRRLMVYDTKIVQDLRLSRRQLQAFHLVKNGARTARDIADAMEVENSRAGELLSILYMRGYLKRTTSTRKFVTYEYWCFDDEERRPE